VRWHSHLGAKSGQICGEKSLNIIYVWEEKNFKILMLCNSVGLGVLLKNAG
jgi:hypothetical protein